MKWLLYGIIGIGAALVALIVKAKAAVGAGVQPTTIRPTVNGQTYSVQPGPATPSGDTATQVGNVAGSIANRIVPGIGGAVDQVTTSTYRAADQILSGRADAESVTKVAAASTIVGLPIVLGWDALFGGRRSKLIGTHSNGAVYQLLSPDEGGDYNLMPVGRTWKRHIASPAVLYAHGWSFSEIDWVSDAVAASYPTGSELVT